MNSDQLQELIKNALYKKEVSCGVDFSDKEYFPISYPITKQRGENSSLLYIVPIETYRPRVYVTFDFTHSYVQSLESQSEQDKTLRRLVPKEILLKYAEKLMNYMNYYIDAVDVYEKSGEYSKGQNLVNDRTYKRIYTSDEKEANIFINEFINYFLTSITVNRRRNDIGTANVTFKDNRNLIGKGNLAWRALYEESQSIMYQLFMPMLPVRIWARGRFYKQYFFPIFDGYVNTVSPSDNQGYADLEITCKDVLELARISNEMIRPSVIQQAEEKNLDTLNFQSLPFFNHDHLDIVKTIFMGGVLEFAPTNKEGQQAISLAKALSSQILQSVSKITGAKDKKGLDFMSLDSFSLVNSITDGFQDKIKSVKSSAIKESKISFPQMVSETSHFDNMRKLVLWGAEITPYRAFGLQSPDIFKSDFASRLDVLNEVASTVYHDFYVDGSGNVNYHPQRFSNDFLINDIICYTPKDSGVLFKSENIWPGIYVVGPEEYTTCSSVMNIDSLITHLKLVGQDQFAAIDSEVGNLVAKAVYRKYLNRFGYRRDVVNSQLFNKQFSLDSSNSKKKSVAFTFGFLMAASMLIYRNAELYTKEATLVFRPEMDLCRPIYFTDDKTVFYINSITHNITVGGDATTSISLNFGRKYEEQPADLFNMVVASEKIAKTGYDAIDPEEMLKLIQANNWIDFLDESAEEEYELAVANLETMARLGNDFDE